MNRIILIVVLMVLPLFSFSQFSITGIVVDKSNVPVEYGEIYLVKDSLNAVLSISDKKGRFFINSQRGKYFLNVKYFGENIYSSDIIVNKDLDLGIIQINTVCELEEVTVVGNEDIIERKIDRLVFNAEHFLGAAGGDALDLLKVTPSLMVSNNQISIIGKSSVAVMINDRLINLSGDELQGFLKTIRSEDIKKIEVVTNPPAKYDAEGNSGLLNIVLKKSKKNYWNSFIQTSYQQGKYAKESISGSLNYNKDKLSMYLSAYYNIGESSGNENSELLYPKITWVSNQIDKYKTNLLSTRIGFDYNVTNNVIVGAQYIGSFNKPDYVDHNLTIIEDSESKLAYISTDGHCDRYRDFHSANMHSIFKLDTLGKKFNFDVDYLTYSADGNRDFKSITHDSKITEFVNKTQLFRNISNQDIVVYSSKVDLEYPMQIVDLNFGCKVSQTETNNDISFYDITNDFNIKDYNKSNIFEYTENTQAFYMSAYKKLGSKWESKFGLRGEYTQTKGYSRTLNNTHKNSYFKLFPTAYITYKPNDNNSLSLDYGRRISRPGFKAVNPFRFYTSPYVYSEGNPFLKPVLSTNIELNYTYKSIFQSVIYYSHQKDNSGQVSQIDKDNYIQAVVRKNYFSNDAFGFRQVILIRRIQWWTSLNSLNLIYVKSNSNIYPITQKSMESFSAIFKTTNHFILNNNKTLLAGFDYQYIPAMESSDLVYNYDKTHLNIFFKILLFNKDVQISCVGNNILKAYSFNTKSVRNGVKAFYRGYYDSQNFRISLSYRFGNKKVRVSKRNASNSDEKNRTNL